MRYKGLFMAGVFCFLLILIAGAGRLIGHEEQLPDPGVPEVRESVLAAPSAGQTEPVQLRAVRTEQDRLHVISQVNVPGASVRVRTDANGTVIAGRRSYLHLRYQAFSLSDGFV
ncbi:MAG: hypothetical protein IJ242_01835 [Clostridia bacterium]|nr:hypothetical protein [Clostridia bacterium]